MVLVARTLVRWCHFLVYVLSGRFEWPRGLMCGSAAPLLLGLQVRIPPVAWIICLVCCQVDVSASGWSLAQRSPTKSGVFECDHESLTMRRPWLTRGGFYYVLIASLLVCSLSWMTGAYCRMSGKSESIPEGILSLLWASVCSL